MAYIILIYTDSAFAMFRRVFVISTKGLFRFRSHLPKLNNLFNPLSCSFTNFQNKNKFRKIDSNTDQKNEQLKQKSKQFYNNYVQKIVQLKNSADFQQLVANIKDPVILDLYADWCEPCKKLTPRLQNKVNSLDQVKMIKINIDKCPQIAHALQVKSVPTVYLLYKGQAIDKIQGNVSQNQFNKFFQTINKITGATPEHKQAIQTLERAKGLMAQKKFIEAAQILQKFKEKKVTLDLIAIKSLLLCQCYLTIGKVSKFKDNLTIASQYENFIKQVPDLSKFYEIMKMELNKYEEECKQDPQIKVLKSRIGEAESKEKKLDAMYELANYYKSKQLTENALETAMQIIKEDKSWQEKKANQLVLLIFKQLSNGSPLVQKYRKILQRLLS